MTGRPARPPASPVNIDQRAKRSEKARKHLARETETDHPDDAMQKILRYTIKPETEIPEGAVLLDIQAGQTGISAWFICDPEAPKETRHFAGLMTGQPLPDAIADCPHLATVKVLSITKEGTHPLAIHLFDVTHLKDKIPDWKPDGHSKPKDPADWWKS